MTTLPTLPVSLLTASGGVALFTWYLSRFASIDDRAVRWHECNRYYYELDERFGLEDPPVRLQEKRFDLERMLQSVRRTAEPPPRLDDYRTRAESPNDTRVYSDWNRSEQTLQDMCDWLIKCAAYRMRENNPEPRRRRCLEVMRDFVRRYAAAMEGRFDKVFPWGRNWYQFSISSSLMLFYYMIAEPDVAERRYAVDLLLRIVETPCRSLGKRRDQANSIYMALPWIVARYYRGDVETAARHPDYRYVVDYIKFPVVERRKTVGLYRDYAYITHTNVPAYGYLSEMTAKSLPVVAFDNMMRNFNLDWKAALRLLAHPTLPYGPIGFFARDRRVTAPVNPDSPLGIEVIPTILFLRMYGEDYSFACRGQNDWIAYYESDPNNDDMAQYWVQYRGVRYAGRRYEARFPDFGFVYTPTTRANGGGERVASRIRVPTTSSTTTSFVPDAVRDKPIRYGFCFAYGKIGMMRHFYRCRELVHDPKGDPEYGLVTVDEYVLCDYERHTIDIWQRIRKVRQFDLVIYTDSEYLWKSGTGASGIAHIRHDCRTRSSKFDFRVSTSTTDEIAEKYPPGIRVVSTDDTVVLLDNDQPKMAMYPDDWESVRGSFRTLYKGVELEFAHDNLTNQFWLTGLCIDKR